MKTCSLPYFVGWMLLCAVIPARADVQANIYVCVNSNGTREYSNIGQGAGCKQVHIQGIPTLTPPVQKPVAQAAAPTKTASVSTPANFPKIDSHTQKSRDTERMHILIEEMKAEEGKLASLKQEFNNGEPERRGDERNYAKYQARTASLKEDIERARKNVDALKREIGNLK